MKVELTRPEMQMFHILTTMNLPLRKQLWMLILLRKILDIRWLSDLDGRADQDWEGKKQGRTEPIPLVMKEDSLCLGRLTLEFEQADEATRNRKLMEIEKEDTDELQQKYQNEQEKEKAIEESLKDLKEMFYCELCDKQYFKYKEYDNHINSYDHAHRQRLRDLRQRESTRNIYVKKKKEQKQMEKEMQRLHLLSGKGAESKSNTGIKVAFKSSLNASSTSSGFKPISLRHGFSAVPPPPPKDPPPLPKEPAPPLPDEPQPPPPPPPPEDKQIKKPFSFKMGMSSGDQGQVEALGTVAPVKQGLSFSLGAKKGGGVMQFGVKSKPVKGTVSAFAESSSEEEEEEEEVPEEDARELFENEQLKLSSTPTQQQDTLEKVIEYADTLRIKAALKPKLLIRFVRGTDQGGILPGTIATPEDPEITSETTNVEKRTFKEIKETKKTSDREDSSDSEKESRLQNEKRSFKERKGYKRSPDKEDFRSSASDTEARKKTAKNKARHSSSQGRGEQSHQKDKDREYMYFESKGRNSPGRRKGRSKREGSKDYKDRKGSNDSRRDFKDHKNNEHHEKEPKGKKDRKDARERDSPKKMNDKYKFEDSDDEDHSQKSSTCMKKKDSKTYTEKREFKDSYPVKNKERT